MKNIILASTSTLFGEAYLAYLKPVIKELFHNIPEIIFIPFARPGGITHNEYAAKASEAFKGLGITVKGLHTFKNQQETVKNAHGFFTGGGNTFLLVQQLHALNLMMPLKEAIEKGAPYLGASAGSNIAGMNMKTTNDMPIVYPPDFTTMGLVPFNLNPHYLDPDLNSKHNGETRETRIKEFHTQNDIPVVGLREGSWIKVKGAKITIEGQFTARIFERDKEAYEISSNSELSFNTNESNLYV